MARKKYDGVIEAVRYAPEGKINQVRIYERRGPTYSDRVLINRAELLQRLHSGKKFGVGRREELMASTFTINGDVRLAGSRSQEVIVSSGANSTDRDDLQGAPLF